MKERERERDKKEAPKRKAKRNMERLVHSLGSR